MAEFFFFLFLVAPLLIGWWMITARRKAHRLLRDRAEARTALDTIAYEESTLGADGLSYGRSHPGDGAMLPPEDPTASLEGIKAIEGRR